MKKESAQPAAAAFATAPEVIVEPLHLIQQRAIVGQIVPNREVQGSGFKLQDSITRS